MTDIASRDYDLQRDVSAFLMMIEDDWSFAAVDELYETILDQLQELIILHSKANSRD